MRQGRRMTLAFSLAASLAIVAAACGSDNSSSSSGAATTTAASGGATTTAASGGATTTAASGGATTTAAGGAITCKPGTAVSTPIKTQQADGKGKSVGLLFDLTGRGDKSFNDGAAAGLDKAKADFGITGNESTPTAQDGSDRPERIKALAGNNALVVAVGFLWGDATTASAAQNPNQKYAIIDSVVYTVGADGKPTTTPAPNVRSIVYAANEGSFLAGAAAACASKSGKIGFLGGVENDLIKSFEVGFVAGVKQVNPKATVDIKYITQPPDFTGFTDPAKGKSISKAMYDSGDDVIYAAAGSSGIGMFQAVKETGKKPGEVWAIGVDSDQYLTVPADEQPYVLTSALKRVDVGTYEAIADQLNGKLTGEVKTYDLKNNGVGYAASNPAINQYAGTLEDLKQQIIDGKITVPNK
jgi:basic membrane protein A